MKTSNMILLAGMAMAVDTHAEIYKCPGDGGHPLFTSTRREGCEVQTVNPVIPTNAEVAAAKARINRLAQKQQERETELERQRAAQAEKRKAAATAARREQEAKEKASAQAQEDENELLRMLR